jgi:hypothetical protein
MEISDLPLAQARAGMVLGNELRDAQGGLLLPRGTVLTAAMLASLQRLGLDTLRVEAPHAARIDYLFRKLDPAGADAWAGTALREHLRAYRAGAAG